MNFTLKRWTHLGLGAALAGSAALGACSGEKAFDAAKPAASHAGHGATSGEGEGGETAAAGEAVIDMAVLPIEKRAAFQAGHVAAGLALYRAGDSAGAAPHLRHPVSETHQTERAGLDRLGFKPEIFEKVAAALEAGKPASEVEPLLLEAEVNVAAVRLAAGGSTKDIVNFLMDVCAVEYKAGVGTTRVLNDQDFGVGASGIVNAGEYQDAYGFAVVARDLIRNLNDDPLDPLRMEIEVLIRMWPSEGPVVGVKAAPAPAELVAAQISRVKLELSTLE